jgi:hypothetical protein
MEDAGFKHFLGGAILLVGLVFVYRSFYGMRIPDDPQDDAASQATLKSR